MKTNQSWCKILLVDDDPICHLISEKIIQRYSSHSLECFTNPREALEKLRNWSANAPEKIPDFILLDLNMPEMDGWRFLDEFEKLPAEVSAKTEVFILSSSFLQADRDRARAYGVVKNFLSKPLTEDMVKMFSGSCN